MLRVFSSAFAALAISLAPFQCAHDPDPSARREDTVGDALWGLARDFHARHEDASERETLAYLAEKYPSSRYAAAARDELARVRPSDSGP